MRTTMTLDNDVAKKLKERIKESGKSAKEVCNELLRIALSTQFKKSKKNKIKLSTFEGKSGLAPDFNWDMSYREIADKLDEDEWKTQ